MSEGGTSAAQDRNAVESRQMSIRPTATARSALLPACVMIPAPFRDFRLKAEATRQILSLVASAFRRKEDLCRDCSRGSSV